MGTDRLALQPQRTDVPATAAFRSILFGAADADLTDAAEPPFFVDLNLDQAVESIVAGRDEYDLEPFFYTPLRDEDTVVYRQEVFRDLETEALRAAVRAFAQAMQRTRQYLALVQKQHYTPERERWFLDAAEIYSEAVRSLADSLGELELDSRGFNGFRRYLSGYATSEQFGSLTTEARTVRAGLDRVRYTLRIRGGRVTVSGYHDERDYTVEVEETFARFRESTAASHRVEVPDSGSMDHVEARIAQLVARLHPEAFAALDRFCERHQGFCDRGLVTFDREIQFYLAYIEHSERLTRAGAMFCYPTVSARSKEIAADDAFDLALAAKLSGEGGTVVSNDFVLAGAERILVVTGPNQGGKTTFARMFGQLHYLAGLGLPVPGSRAQLFLPDRIFTHFERQEDITTLRGKLDDELVRMRDILEQATAASVVVINEIFASTTLADAVQLGQDVLRRIVDLGCLAVCVTFVDELTTLGEATVSMVATVPPEDPSRRTFKVVRKPADGRAYAWAIAEKYGVSYERLKGRISR